MKYSTPTPAALSVMLAGLTVGVLWGVLQPAAEAQETQVNVTTNQQTIVVIPTPPPAPPAQVVFFATDDREAVKPGDVVTYRIVVDNQRQDDINEITITARIPDFLVPLETSPAADANPDARTLTWRDQTISALSEVTFAFRARIAPETPPGHVIRMTAEINGPGVRSSFTDSTLVEGMPAGVAGQPASAPPPPPAPPANPAGEPADSKPLPPVPPTAGTGPGSMVLMGLITATIAGAIGTWRVLRSQTV